MFLTGWDSRSLPTKTWTATQSALRRNRIIEIEGDVLLREISQNGRTAACSEHDPAAVRRGMVERSIPRVSISASA